MLPRIFEALPGSAAPAWVDAVAFGCFSNEVIVLYRGMDLQLEIGASTLLLRRPSGAFEFERWRPDLLPFNPLHRAVAYGRVEVIRSR